MKVPLTFNLVLEIVLVKFDGDSRPFLQAKVELTVLIDSDIGPRTFSVLAWSVNDNTFTVG